MATNSTFDVIIAGGGLVGMSLAIALESGGLKVAVIDRLAPSDMLEDHYDGRASAISYANMRMLDVLGIKEHIVEFTEIKEILVSDGKIGDGVLKNGAIGLTLHFDKDEITETDEPLGYMVQNRYTRFALDKVLSQKSNITRFAPDALVEFENKGSFCEAKLQSGLTISAKLLIGCDGRGSLVRKKIGAKTYKFGYGQTGIVTNVKMEKPHNNVAYEHFLPSGPFAILPLETDKACIVWSEQHIQAKALVGLSSADFCKELQKRFGDILGNIEVISPIFSYPLELELSSKWFDKRAALCGDAAHGIHPVAGQGFNLGLKDVAALAEVIIDAYSLGLDIGDEIVLEKYASWRRTDTIMVAAACDAFVRLFSNDFGPLRALRNIGIGFVDSISPLRKFFARHAGGAVGDLPKLLKGIPLL